MQMDPKIRERAHDAFLKYWAEECGLQEVAPAMAAAHTSRSYAWSPSYDTQSQMPETLMLDDLLALVHEFAEQPVTALRPVIRLLVLERLYMDQGGDSMALSNEEMASEAYVDTVVRVLEKVRQQMICQGQAMRCPVPPLMCG